MRTSFLDHAGRWTTSEAAKHTTCHDILRCIAEQIIWIDTPGHTRNRKLLHDLCLVCKTFQEIFSPFLYRDVSINTLEQMQRLEKNQYVNKTCSLSLSCKPQDNWLIRGQRVDSLFRQVLLNMPHLESLKWVGLPFSVSTVKALQSRRIKAIHIVYPESMVTTLQALDKYVSLHPPTVRASAFTGDSWNFLAFRGVWNFRGLEELTLQNIYGNINEWIHHIAKILIDSPTMRKLSLSISAETIHADQDANVACFLDLLAVEYVDQGGLPLRLQTLQCGAAIYPFASDSFTDDLTEICKLTNLSYLEDLYIDNSAVFVYNEKTLELYGDFDSDSEFPYLSPEECEVEFGNLLSCCPNLRRFSTAWLHNYVLKALCGLNKSQTRKLAVSFKKQNAPDPDDDQTVQLARAFCDYYEYPDPLELRMMDLNLVQLTHQDLSYEEIIDGLVATNADTLEGLAINMPNKMIERVDAMKALAQKLRPMPKLSQLRICIILLQNDSNRLSNEVLEHVVQELASGMPQLRFISVYPLNWRIWRETTPGGTVVIGLESLDERETAHVELFSHSIFEGTWYSR